MQPPIFLELIILCSMLLYICIEYVHMRVLCICTYVCKVLEKTPESHLDWRRSDLSIPEEISPEYSLEGLMLKLKLQYSGRLMWRTDSLEKTLMLGKIEGGRSRDDRGWDGRMASPTWSTWVWVNSGSWWWTGRPGVLQSMGSQRVRRDWVTEQNWCVYGHLSGPALHPVGPRVHSSCCQSAQPRGCDLAAASPHGAGASCLCLSVSLLPVRSCLAVQTGPSLASGGLKPGSKSLLWLSSLQFLGSFQSS